MSQQSDDLNIQQFDSVFMLSNEIDGDIFNSISLPIPHPSPSSPEPASLHPTELPRKKKMSKEAQKLLKQRDRMRTRRAIERENLSVLTKRVEALADQLQQLLKIREYRYTQNALIMHRTQETQRDILMRAYIQLIETCEQIRQENEENEQILYSRWNKYVNFVNYQIQKFYGPPPVPKSPKAPHKHELTCQPMNAEQVRSKKYKSNGSGQWVSFAHNPRQEDRNILLFRESTDDVYFRRISNKMCTKLLADACDEGTKFTSVIQQVLEHKIPSITTDVEYFGWKMLYYKVSTQEAYPHLTSITQVDSGDDMIRFEFIKQYTLETNQDFNSIFNQIQQRLWNVMVSKMPLAGLHFSLKTMVGCVLQTLNDQTCIVIRSFVSKRSQTIHRFVSLIHRSEHEYYVSIVSPHHCVERTEGQEDGEFDNFASSKYGCEKIFWESHGHARFTWHSVNDREYELRYGGTLLLGDYSLKTRIVELGELLVGWEQILFQKGSLLPAGG